MPAPASPSPTRTPALPVTEVRESSTREYPVSGEQTHTFLFDGREYSVRTEVREGYIEASRDALNRFRSGNTDASSSEEAFYRSMVLNTSQELLYDDILTDLRAYRTRYNLDDATYVELILAYVQSFSYETQSDYIRLPVEVVSDDRGDCDERACLLAGLLQREGYDTALIGIHLANGRSNHMGVGVKSNGFRFSSSEYTFLETTAPFPVGYSPFDTRAMKLKGLTEYYATKTGVAVDDMVGQPLVYRIGNGARRYGNGVKAQEIYNAALHLESAHLQCHTDLSTEEKVVEEYQRDIENCVSAYGCENFDTYEWMYEDAVKKYNDNVARHNSIVELYTYLLGNTDSTNTIRSRVGAWAYGELS